MTAVDDRPETATAEVGKARRRKEDQRLITGRTRWTDNIVLPGMLHLAMVRSPFAHARVTSIDTSAAKAAPNVVDVIVAGDIADGMGVCANAWPITSDQVTPDHLPMVSDHVACAGEIVAAVIARSPGAARDAAELVDVEYDELPAVLDGKEAMKDEVLAHPDKGTNKSAFWQLDSKGGGTGGDIEEAIAEARAGGILIEREYRQQRLIPAFMEPRSTVVDPTGEQITIWSATQIPHILRFLVAATTGIPESKIRVIAPDVGGGFGGKLQTTPEEFVTLAAARRTGKPVKYTETRSESLLSAHHGRDQYQKLTLAATKEGRVTGLKVDLVANLGAYVAIIGGGVPVLGAWMFNSIYKFDAYQFNCQTVLTNTTWVDAYRGAGRPEATYGIERIMDELAVEVGKDPLEVREMNWIKHEEFPFTTVAGMTYDSGNYEAATAKAKELFGYDELRAEQARRREAKDPVQLGIGVSTFTEMCGLAPSRVLGQLSYGAGGWEHAAIRMLPTGKVEVITGTSPHGQGHETAWSQIVADRLGVPFEDVEVLHGDTQIAHRGLDTYGSRSLVVGGEAVVKAADKVIEKARAFAAHLLEANADDLEFSAGRFGVKGTDKGVTIGEVALATFASHNYPGTSSPASTPRRPTTPSASPSRTAPTCARWRSTPRPARPGCASTSASTTSARSSTRSSSRARSTAASSRASRRRSGRTRSTTPRGRSSPARSSTTPSRRRRTRSPSSPTTRRARRRPTRSAPRASARRARSPRRRPSSTRSSTRSGTSASRTSRCRARPSGCGGRSRAAPARVTPRRRPSSSRTSPATAPMPTRIPARPAKGATDDPRNLRLPRADHGGGGARRPRRAR